MAENLTKQYKDYAVYLPSLQKHYAQFVVNDPSVINRKDYELPSGFRLSDLNFLNSNSRLWHCGYMLYSAGQFSHSQISNPDIVSTRKREGTTVVGDSGGFQLGTGAITNTQEKAHLEKYKNSPDKQFEMWNQSGFRERTLNWLDTYTDYAMTLDMVLWATTGENAKDSQLRNMSTQQLIDLSVANLEFFDQNRSRGRHSTKFLSVLQDVGNGTGEAWYKAVKDFEFEGWALGSETGAHMNSLKWLRRLLYDKKLDNSEWIHLLAKSPPINSVLYTAVQMALRDELNSDITVSLDSSTPHRTSGTRRALTDSPKFGKDIKDWRFSEVPIVADIRIARGDRVINWEIDSPLRKFFDMNVFYGHKRAYSDSFVDGFSEHLLTNHNIYTFHKAAIDGCDLVFSKAKRDETKVPDSLLGIVGLVTEYFKTETPEKTSKKLVELLSLYSKDNNTETEEERV